MQQEWTRLPFIVANERPSRFCPYCGGVNIKIWNDKEEGNDARRSG